LRSRWLPAEGVVNYISLPYEILLLKDKKKLGLTVEETIRQWINIKKGKINYVIKAQNEFKTGEVIEVLKLFNDKLKVPTDDIIDDKFIKEVEFLIKNEILFYDILNSVIKPTSIIEWEAIKELLKDYNVK